MSFISILQFYLMVGLTVDILMLTSKKQGVKDDLNQWKEDGVFTLYLMTTVFAWPMILWLVLSDKIK